MATVIAQRTLRNQNAAIIAAVAAGESFVVTRNGTPIAELRPVTTAHRVFVPRAELVTIAARSSNIDVAAFREDLDRVVAPDL